jgi:signal peptidase I
MGRLLDGFPRPLQALIGWAFTIAVAIAIVLGLRAEIASPYRIPSSSMEPTLHCARPAEGCLSGSSDRILANRFSFRFRAPKRGEIVVFETPPRTREACAEGGTFVKRIVGLPGETIAEQAGVISVDGRRLIEPYVLRSERDTRSGSWPRIPAGQYFMLGDNRSNSCDSRDWGTVPRANLIGPVFLTYWPPRRLHTP